MKTLLSILLLTLSLSCFGQQWKDTNRGLYPQSVQVTYNARNTAVGMRYTYLFQKPFYGVPVGLYGSFSNTIKPDMRYNNYPWERKYSLGGLVTIPYSREMNGIHTMITVAVIYNSHPDNYVNDYPGKYDSNLYYTTFWGCDLGLQWQLNRFTCHLTVDAINFFRYAEVGFGYTFYRIKKIKQ